MFVGIRKGGEAGRYQIVHQQASGRLIFILTLVEAYDGLIDGCSAHYNCRHGITRSLCYVRRNI